VIQKVEMKNREAQYCREGFSGVFQIVNINLDAMSTDEPCKQVPPQYYGVYGDEKYNTYQP